MAPVRVIYEYGITAKINGSDWHIVNIGGGQTEKIDHPGIIEQRYNVRPIVVTELCGNGPEINRLLQTGSSYSFGLKITDWEGHAYRSVQLDKIFNTAYLLRATEYHCTQLALLYSDTCDRMRKIYDIPGRTLEEGVHAIYGNGEELYYEFDALITAVRRTYDSCRYLLWQFFGTEGTTPSSFHRTLENCPSLPVELKGKLIESWSKHGEEITTYRDCIQHYVPIDFANSSLIMHKLDNGAWSTRAPIPDNPNARSRFKFEYKSGRDALTYGWESANEVIGIATLIIESIPVPTNS